MKLFSCQACGQMLFFENVRCERCSRRVGYCSEGATLLALDPADGDGGVGAGGWIPVGGDASAPRMFCVNAEQDACNWLVPAGTEDQFCVACAFNRVIPDLTVEGNLELWRKLEAAKHYLIYSLLLLKLPIKKSVEAADGGLIFDFMDDPPDGEEGQKVMTGHDEGVITVALREANDAEREKMRLEMGEYYRTVLGHFRHEIGHYYWNVLVRDAGQLDACRAVFGDDSQDYGAALTAHYENGPPVGWQATYVSSYATTHPWEDFAETWAHYIHIVDTLQTAMAFGLVVDTSTPEGDGVERHFNFDPYSAGSFDEILKAWLPLTVVVNALNRSMGQADLYPFVITPEIAEKLRFIHQLVHGLVLPGALTEVVSQERSDTMS
ncbi:putative zinc-binding metallopeptidase [Acetobacter sp. DsW_063]|uniref:zinc-binding metallopeptidase family protein n=1 Tax=Acetobacter sp. DsW_063 TaxID=1514894 RepID=UPI000A38278C|nr:putative zinc-binding metallopeptidase [Acetobacter sp. DsW_063]